MQKHNSKIRKANALAAALLTAFFLAHALLGAFSRLFLNADAPTIIVWAFIFVAFVHIALCLITSRLMLTDTVRPPSRKKKNHLWLKWASGAALAACAAPHALGWDASARWFTLLVLALLAWHAYIGCKSLARDHRRKLRHRSHRCSIADQRLVTRADTTDAVRTKLPEGRRFGTDALFETYSHLFVQASPAVGSPLRCKEKGWKRKFPALIDHGGRYRI